jgi:hypothetical protein
MIVAVYLVIAFLVLTKLCDVASTLQRLEHPREETNPIARQTMLRVGTTKAVWVVFVLALIIIGLAGWAAINGGNIMQALFIVAGVAISIVQGAAANCNWTGRDNAITRRVRILHSGLCRNIPKSF